MMLEQLNTLLLGWPLLMYVLGVSVVCTIAFAGIQLRYFFYSWKITLFPPKEATAVGVTADMTPLQAFINTLSANLGNGSIAGMATAIYSGGPGAAIWVVIIGVLLMAVRFAEVYLSTYFAEKNGSSRIGGPMLYLRELRGGVYVANLYAFFCLLFGLLIGNAMQTNSIRISLETTGNVSPWVTAFIMFFFIMYIIFGGARRIVAASEAIVPIKVIIFFVSTLIVLGYHYASLIPALKLMVQAAFTPSAVAGGALGFSALQAMRYGILRSTMATESGVGTAAILFGSTGSKEPVKDGIISMLSTFISTLVCFIVAWCIVASGVWDNGLTSTALTIAAFQTVFGWLSGWVVSFLSVSFGIGVLVSFAYITKEAWLSLTGGKFAGLFCFIFGAVAFAGALFNATVVFKIGDFIISGMLVINMLGILYLIPVIKKGISSFQRQS